VAARAAAVAVLLCLLAGPGLAAGPESPAAPAGQESGGIVVTGVSGHAATVTEAALAGLPQRALTVSFQTERGARRDAFVGPLLWAVLDHVGAVAAGDPRAAVHEVVLVTGSDGYTAALGLGEIAPAFEGKPVILAERMDGQALALGHFRIVVPGDRYGGRYVRDVVRIAVVAPAPPKP
jgi:Oxidoreductase molybdopterin binding domain